MPGDVVPPTAPARRPTVLTLAAGRVAAVGVELPARYDPSPTPGPTAAARPAATAAPTAARAKAVPAPSPKATRNPATTSPTVAKATPAKAAPAKVTPVRTPPPAIVYRYRAAGRATWGPFGGAVITRLPPGTQIRVCGRLGCWEGVSSGHGPTADGGNLVDLSSEVFRRILRPAGDRCRIDRAELALIAGIARSSTPPDQPEADARSTASPSSHVLDPVGAAVSPAGHVIDDEPAHGHTRGLGPRASHAARRSGPPGAA